MNRNMKKKTLPILFTSAMFFVGCGEDGSLDISGVIDSATTEQSSEGMTLDERKPDPTLSAEDKAQSLSDAKDGVQTDILGRELPVKDALLPSNIEQPKQLIQPGVSLEMDNVVEGLVLNADDSAIDLDEQAATKLPAKDGQLLQPTQPIRDMRGAVQQLRPQVNINMDVATVTLPERPENPVMVIVDASGATVDSAKLNFDGANWDLPQFVIVEPNEDADAPKLVIGILGGQRVMIPVPKADDEDEDEESED